MSDFTGTTYFSKPHGWTGPSISNKMHSNYSQHQLPVHERDWFLRNTVQLLDGAGRVISSYTITTKWVKTGYVLECAWKHGTASCESSRTVGDQVAANEHYRTVADVICELTILSADWNPKAGFNRGVSGISELRSSVLSPFERFTQQLNQKERVTEVTLSSDALADASTTCQQLPSRFRGR